MPLTQREKNVRYYATHRDQEIQRVRRRQAAALAFLRDLRNVPCADCGGRFQPHQMDFDHRDPSAKRFRVSSAAAVVMSRARLQAEIAKCDIVCANCHRLRSRRQHQARLVTQTPSTHPRIDGPRARWRHHADILDQLRSVPCADCGGQFAPCAMDFDHRDPSTKVLGVTRLISRSYRTLMAEVGKCDIVCANCHRLRTFNRRMKQAA